MLSRPLCLPGLLAGTLVVAACSGNGAGPGGADTGAGLDGGHKSDATERDGGKDGSMQGHDGAVDAGPTGPAVLQHHADGTHAGLYVDPAFTKAAIPGLEPLPGFHFVYPDLGVVGGMLPVGDARRRHVRERAELRGLGLLPGGRVLREHQRNGVHDALQLRGVRGLRRRWAFVPERDDVRGALRQLELRRPLRKAVRRRRRRMPHVVHVRGMGPGERGERLLPVTLPT